MRTSTLLTISLPPALASQAEKAARTQHMTRSELFRDALRNYIEELMAEEAIHVFEKERRDGKLKTLSSGSLADLMS